MLCVFSLPDKDLFRIDASSLETIAEYSGLGTTIYNLLVNPQTGFVYATNTDSQNHVRFEGPGVHGGSTVQGNIAQARITAVDPSTGVVSPRHLNKHIDYGQLKASQEVRDLSIATPLQMAIDQSGENIWVASLGSNRVAKYSTAVLESDAAWSASSVNEMAANYLDIDGGASQSFTE